MLKYNSVHDLCEAANAAKKRVSDVVLADQAAELGGADEVFSKMRDDLHVMQEAIQAGMDKNLRSTSGLSGGDAFLLSKYAGGKSISGEFLAKSCARAIAVCEYNAAMGKIVAAPTAGSCGVLPGTVVSMLEEGRCDEESAVMSMISAAAVGMVIAKNASIAGASGGCQAECGSAAAMAAAALVELSGGSPEQIENAVALAIKSLLGLVCDPVAGLVEIPCIKRNAAAVSIAFLCADMALAGIKSKIPVDECIEAMKSVGDSLPCALKETAQGGLAVTKTGLKLKKQIFG